MVETSLRKQLEAANTGDVIITTQTRTGVYVAAARAGVTVSTKEIDGGVEVLVVGPVLEVKRSDETHEEIVERIFAKWGREKILEFFGKYELCCGMNRGECICLPETPIAEISDTIGDSDSIADIGIPISAATPEDEWEGWSGEQEEHDGTSGETIIYRKQLVRPFRVQEIRREH